LLNQKKNLETKRKETYLGTIKVLESDKYIFEENWASSRSGRRVPIAVDKYTMSMNGTKTSADLPCNEQSCGASAYTGSDIKFEG
jgi:hypothetical protein